MPGSERYTRFLDCRYIQWSGEVINTQTGKVTGTINGATVLWDTLYYNSRSWNENIELAIGSVTGTGVGGTINAPIACYVGVVPVPSTCQLNGRGSWAGQSGQLPAGQNDQYSGELGFESITTVTVEFVFNVDMTWTPPGVPPASEPIGATEPIHCDSSRPFYPTSGCVYVNFTENMFVVSKSDPKVTEAARFMDRAQKAIPTHPGVFGVGGPPWAWVLVPRGLAVWAGLGGAPTRLATAAPSPVGASVEGAGLLRPVTGRRSTRPPSGGLGRRGRGVRI